MGETVDTYGLYVIGTRGTIETWQGGAITFFFCFCLIGFRVAKLVALLLCSKKVCLEFACSPYA